MGSDNIYFVAAAGTPAAKPFADWLDASNKHTVWVRAFAKRHDLGKVEWISNNNTVVVGFRPMYKKPCLWADVEEHWKAYLTAHPLWRRIKSGNGCDYCVPRRDSTDGKVLAKEWSERPRPRDGEGLGHIVTGVNDFLSWMQGMTRHIAGWRIREDKSVIVVVPHHVTQAKSWKPLAGLKRGNQEKLRAEWHAKED